MSFDYGTSKISVWRYMDLALADPGSKPDPLASTTGDVSVHWSDRRGVVQITPTLNVRVRPLTRHEDEVGSAVYTAWLEVRGAAIDMMMFPEAFWISGDVDNVRISEEPQLEPRGRGYLFTPEPLPRVSGEILIKIEPGA